MTRNHEKLLVAALAGMIIAGAAVLAIQPAVAQKMDAKSFSSRLVSPSSAVLDLRLSDKA
jgi:hypothetical protein